jgi:hypothetical protein
VAADDGGSEPANQIVVFGGASLLDAARESSYSWEPDLPDFPGFPGRPGFPGFPGGRFPAIDVQSATTLGNSPLFGVRYSRYIKDRLAVEADLSVAPGHDLESRGEVCADDRCFGGRDFGRFGLDRRDLARGDRRVTAWQDGAGLAYDVTGGDVRPVVIFGAGGATWAGSGQTSTDFELRFGGGLKILFGDLGARIDVVDHLVLDHYLSGKSEHNIHVTAGFLVGF